MEPRWYRRGPHALSPPSSSSSSQKIGSIEDVGMSLTPTITPARLGTATTWSSYGHHHQQNNENRSWGMLCDSDEPTQSSSSNSTIGDESQSKSISDSVLTALRSSAAPGLLFGNIQSVTGKSNNNNHSLLLLSSPQQRAPNNNISSSSSNNTVVGLTQSTEAVRELLSTITERCCLQQQNLQQQQQAVFITANANDPSSSLSPSPTTVASIATPPEQECHLLAQWAAMDPHYRVVIAALGGIPTLVSAMRWFDTDAGLQTAGCTALQHVCQRNGSNQLAVVTKAVGGVEAIVAAMRNHPRSITVQSAAIGALHCLHAVIMLHVVPANKVMAMELVWLLQHAKKMYITADGRESLESLLLQLRWS